MDKEIKVHCFFEQSGIFKNIFRERGIKAFDYDIENTFNQTDYIVDIFNEIDKYIFRKKNIFENIKKDDIIIAFFPCTYFSSRSCLRSKGFINKKLNNIEKLENSIENNYKRFIFYEKLCQFIEICLMENFQMIFENPLHMNFLERYLPDIETDKIIFHNRNKYGDKFVKPTVFRFYNIESKFNLIQENVKYKAVLNENYSKIYKSLITKEFAEFFIDNFINL